LQKRPAGKEGAILNHLCTKQKQKPYYLGNKSTHNFKGIFNIKITIIQHQKNQ